MVESLIKKLKQCYIYPCNFIGFDDFTNKISESVNNYNNEMTLEAIDGRTPNEAFNNINPFPDRLNCLFKKAFTERIKENQNSNCIPDDLSLIKY